LFYEKEAPREGKKEADSLRVGGLSVIEGKKKKKRASNAVKRGGAIKRDPPILNREEKGRGLLLGGRKSLLKGALY